MTVVQSSGSDNITPASLCIIIRDCRVYPSVGTSSAPTQQSATRFYFGPQPRLFPVNTTLSAIFKFPLPLLRFLLHVVFTKDPIF